VSARGTTRSPLRTIVAANGEGKDEGSGIGDGSALDIVVYNSDPESLPILLPAPHL
jgi:hypothetical protein